MINTFPTRLLTAILMTPYMALAQTEVEGTQAMSSPISITNVLSLITSLIFVIGAILFAGWLYSRMRGVNLSASKVIDVLATQPLGPKEKIVIVQIGTRQIAIGMTPGSLQTLHVFDEPVIEKRESGTATTFSDKLRHALGRGGSK